MTMILGILGLLGGFVALFTLGWRILDARRAYLHIGLTVEEITGRAFKLRTIVENKDFFARKIDGAFLMIGPGDEDPDDTARAIFKHNELNWTFSNSNKMVRLLTDRMEHDTSVLREPEGRMIMPLPYYFEENVDVGDERLSYEQIFSFDQFPAGVHAVRFFIETVSRLHRVVHVAFLIPKQEP